MSRQEAAAYRSVAAAFRNGKDQSDNPYSPRLAASHSWLMGYLNAKVAAAEASVDTPNGY
jgi:hypothetical protein